MRKVEKYKLRCANCKSKTPVHELAKEDFLKAKVILENETKKPEESGLFTVEFEHIECPECRKTNNNVSLNIHDLTKVDRGFLKAFMLHNFTPESVKGLPVEHLYYFAKNLKLEDKYIPKAK